LSYNMDACSSKASPFTPSLCPPGELARGKTAVVSVCYLARYHIEERYHSLSSASSSSPCANIVHHHTKGPAGLQLMVGFHLGILPYTTSVESGKRQKRSENSKEYIQIQ
jgi:hypothetical protein